MPDIESTLRNLSLRQPSPDLDRRIQALTAEKPLPSSGREWRVSLGWAVAFSLLMGIVGFAAGAYWQGDTAPQGFSSFPQAQVHIIYYPSDSKPIFDFTSKPEPYFINTSNIEIKTYGGEEL